MFEAVINAQLAVAKQILEDNKASFEGTGEEFDVLLDEITKIDALIAGDGVGVRKVLAGCPSPTSTENILITPQYGRSGGSNPFILLPSIVPCVGVPVLYEPIVVKYQPPVDDDEYNPPEAPEEPAMGEEIFDVSGTFDVPAGVTSVTVECWGGGAGGNQGNGFEVAGGGGGGGAYSKDTVSVTPSTTETIHVGAGGGTGTDGGDTYFRNSSTVMAKGGTIQSASGGEGGIGGSASSSVGTTKFSGGNGGDGAGNADPDDGGGGGGEAGGSTANGNNGSNGTTGAGGAGGAGAGNGGDGGAGSFGGADGSTGSAPGGGGGGAGTSSGWGGDGWAGRIRVTWVIP